MVKAKQEEVHVVSGVELERYQGVWYEIASVPSRFQPKDGKNTTATYRLSPDGKWIHVLNQTWTGGGRKRASIQGWAWKADPASADAKLLVRFWVPPFLPVLPVTGDYWIMRLDEQNYAWALVGQPSRNYLWVLSRTPQLSDEIYHELLAYAESEGYDVSKVQRTEQDEPEQQPAGGEEEEKSVNDKGTWWLKSLLGM